MAYGLFAYATSQFISGWPDYINVLGALAIGLAAGRGSANEHFRANTVGIIAVGAIAGTPFLLYENVSRTGYGVIGLPVGLIVGLLTGLAAGAVLDKGQNEHYPSRSIRWSPRNGLISGLAIGGVITVLTELKAGQMPVALTLGITIGLGAMVIVGLERVPGDLEIAASPGLGAEE